MEKKYVHVQHGRLANSGYLANCRDSDGRFHLGVILLLGLLSIGLLIGLLVANTQYNKAKSQLTKELQALKQTHKTSIDALQSKLEEKSKELGYALNLAQQNRDSKCNSNDDLLNNQTDRPCICNETLFNLTTKLEQLPTDLPEEESGFQGLSKQNTTCPEGWTKFNCSCYQSFGAGSWDEGREDCISKGGNLVVIDDPEEQTFVSTFAKNPLWIGLSDKETEGFWKWVDGTSLSFTYWAKTQPDGDINTLRGDEDCVLIRSYDDLFWHDYPCSLSMHWICEKVLAKV
ncbi:C-type lectin domain family 10 member A isoform X1 [Fundulus heteroclitus]|uniref:C-type lectin domain family 10 member A isoform X1 n=1 Tax=Fundulus heteroclitus TaxID=8078 RepID=UPI00165BA243|nr:C-type lectin domain family 10 member A isoform X1 [Fundulus heteroclitus]